MSSVNIEYVVAIDLGTSCTAYSWKSAMDPIPSVGVPDMSPNQNIVGKSPTTILIGGSTDADKTFRPTRAEAYGRVAQRRYAENDIPQGAQLFKRFKMVRLEFGVWKFYVYMYADRVKLIAAHTTRPPLS